MKFPLKAGKTDAQNGRFSGVGKALAGILHSLATGRDSGLWDVDYVRRQLVLSKAHKNPAWRLLQEMAENADYSEALQAGGFSGSEASFKTALASKQVRDFESNSQIRAAAYIGLKLAEEIKRGNFKVVQEIADIIEARTAHRWENEGVMHAFLENASNPNCTAADVVSRAKESGFAMELRAAQGYLKGFRPGKRGRPRKRKAGSH